MKRKMKFAVLSVAAMLAFVTPVAADEIIEPIVFEEVSDSYEYISAEPDAYYEADYEEYCEEYHEDGDVIWDERSSMLVYDTDVYLTANTKVTGDVQLDGKTLHLNGFALYVEGNVLGRGGSIILGGNKDRNNTGASYLIVDGDATFESGALVIGSTSEVDIKGDLIFETKDSLGRPQKSTASYSCKNLCKVGGDFLWNSSGEFFYWGGFASGNLELKGDYIDKRGSRYRGTLVLVGDTEQKIDTVKETYIEKLKPSDKEVIIPEYFNVGELLGSVVIKPESSVVRTTERLNINEDYTMYVPCDYEISAAVELNGRGTQLTVAGNMKCPSGALAIGSNAIADIGGNLLFEASDSLGNPVKGSSTYSCKNLCKVGGDFVWNSSGEFFYRGGFASGNLELKGNYIDKRGSRYRGTLVLVGDTEQKIDTVKETYIEKLKPSDKEVIIPEYFNIGELLGNVVIKSEGSVVRTTEPLSLNEEYTLYIPCDYEISAAVVLNGRGTQLTVAGNMSCPSGALVIGSNAVADIGGNLVFETTDTLGNPVKGSATYSCKNLCKVGGDFLWNSSGQFFYYGGFSSGTLELKGNYVDKKGSKYRGTLRMMTPYSSVTVANDGVIEKLFLNGRREWFTVDPDPCWENIHVVIEDYAPQYIAKGGKLKIADFADNSEVTYENAGIASVNPNGTIVGEVKGSTVATITIPSKEKIYVTPINVVVPRFKSKTVYANVNCLSATGFNTNGIVSPVKYTVKSKKIAIVQGDKIKGVKTGKTTITATVQGVKYTATLNVYNPVIKGTNKVGVGKKINLKVTGGRGTTKWSTSKKQIATVDKNGNVTGKKKGKVTITAINNGKKIKKVIYVK